MKCEETHQYGPAEFKSSFSKCKNDLNPCGHCDYHYQRPMDPITLGGIGPFKCNICKMEK